MKSTLAYLMSRQEWMLVLGRLKNEQFSYDPNSKSVLGRSSNRNRSIVAYLALYRGEIPVLYLENSPIREHDKKERDRLENLLNEIKFDEL